MIKIVKAQLNAEELTKEAEHTGSEAGSQGVS